MVAELPYASALNEGTPCRNTIGAEGATDLVRIQGSLHGRATDRVFSRTAKSKMSDVESVSRTPLAVRTVRRPGLRGTRSETGSGRV
jgi:hypothetical protein